jgi:hypothetical protein
MIYVKNSSVSTATRLRAEQLVSQGLIPSRGKKIFIIFMTSRPTLKPTQPHIQWIWGGGGVPLGIKWQEREADR